MISPDLGQYLLIFVAGIAGSFHCIGMCGGFACALGANTHRTTRIATLERHLLYNSGRLTTYVFMGVLAGVLGQSLAGHDVVEGVSTGQRLLAIVAGVLMIVMAFQFFGWLHSIPWVKTGSPSNEVVVPLSRLLAAPGRMAPLAFGVFNGFLPCPLVYAFVAKAAASNDTLSSLLIMVSFGLGTFPAMLLIGGLGYRLSAQWRRYGVWLAGAFILFFGVITLLRGTLPLTGHGHTGL